MPHRLRASFLSLAVLVVSGIFGVAQNRTVLGPSLNSGASDHGLVLLLSENPTLEPSDFSQLKTCLSKNLPLACTLLVVTVKNEGRDTLLTWWSTREHGYMSFDLQKSDGTWEPFPLDNGYLPLSSRSFTYVEKLAPGTTHVERMRLADPDLGIDTALPLDDGRIHTRPPDSEVFTSTRPHKIRLHWNVATCIASRRLRADEVPDAFMAQSFCEADSEMSQTSVVHLQSNVLNLSLGR